MYQEISKKNLSQNVEVTIEVNPDSITKADLKMLRSEEHLATKEYPLVLDGPFSKLDPDQRQNVIDMIPKFAPQVILFSKDDLHSVFDEENIDY